MHHSRRDFLQGSGGIVAALLACGFLRCADALALEWDKAAFDKKIDMILAAGHRDPANAARDEFRHPKDTLMFFGIQPSMTVVEVWPSAGWWTEILAPLLKEYGMYYAAYIVTDAPGMPAFLKEREKAFDAMLAAKPDIYGKVIKTKLLAPKWTEIAPAGSADMVLTFRNVHNWAKAGNADAMFKAFHEALKPGGVLVVKDHRANPGTPFQQQIDTGYMTEEWVIAAAQKAGFKLAEKSEINANPKDTKDHPSGVWTLPPTLRLGDRDKAKYVAIGESDRMTLKFIKP
ncbi:MAG: methyltransferase domain-containing protein [Betaproteobacteria bacterium]|nr:methyltransferase domain-containing protein [Betaproteobacteria bacterium]